MTEPLAAKPPRTMTYQKVDFSIFEATAKELGLDQRELSKALGYSPEAAGKWAQERKIPAVTGLACECLRRRRGNGGTKASTWLVKVENANQQNALEALCKGLGCEWVQV
jgi:hypothetical protein